MHKGYKKPFYPVIVGLGRIIEKKSFNKPPIYVGGCGRSGTTLLLSILSSHEELFAIPRELKLFQELRKNKNGNIQPTRMDRLYRYFLKGKIKESHTRYVEKTPRNIRKIEDIDQYHKGNFKFIQIIRDGRDVVLSKHPKSKDGYWVSPNRWVKDVSVGLQYLNHPNVYTVKYEDLILNFEETIAGICAFLNIPLSDKILNWHKHTTVRKNDAYFTKVEEINKASIGKYKQPENQKRAEELVNYPEAKELLEFYNYL